MVTIPQHSSGFIAFARTIHSKILVVDEERAWIGTSNWKGDYFHHSRNVGLVVEGRSFGARLGASFADLWQSTYAEAVDPARVYEAPRIAEP
jgi:phosphatidylserine/phosphatidylglycerophosphate/cardiolipin synthase-like enzyme